ncbi:MAG: hypothetical protein FJZ43_04170 [Candidatus Staskawiczbacteria bacterium]|nr:hypothetical protein [Candidatus Staskawiczbacteria bacterium]
MKNKFESKETEKTSNGGEASGYLFLIILGLAILTLPSGILAILIYILIYNLFLRGSTENLQEKKEQLAWISTGLSIVFCSIYYFYFFDLNEVGFNVFVKLIISGILCYYALYKIVTWQTLEHEQKSKFIFYLVAISIFFLYYIYDNYNSK